MSKLIAIMSMSLDGFVADPDDGVGEVFGWQFNSGDVEVSTGGADAFTLRMSAPSAAYYTGLTSELGAVLTGRRTFNKAEGWGGNHAWGPAFVLTHQVPDGWPRAGASVHFVTDGLESAVAQAKQAAGEKHVGVHGADCSTPACSTSLRSTPRRCCWGPASACSITWTPHRLWVTPRSSTGSG